MNIIKIADNAYFVPAYSESMIAAAYDTRTTIQSLGPCTSSEDDDHKPAAKAECEGQRVPIYYG